MKEYSRRGLLVREDGAIAVVAGILIVLVLLGVVAVATDTGMVAQERRQLQTAADAGALAGVKALPGNVTLANAEARDFAGRNTDLSALDNVNVSVLFGPAGSSITTSITVEVTARTDLAFARIWGIETANARATATAIVSSPRSYGAHVTPVGVLPEAVEILKVTDDPIVLRFDPGPGLGPGKFGWTAVSMDKPRSKDITDWLTAGGTDAETGDIASREGLLDSTLLQPLFDRIATDSCEGSGYTEEFFVEKKGKKGEYTHPPDMDRDAYLDAVELHFREVVSWGEGADLGFVTINDYDCARLIICPVVENLNTKKDLKIVGFAWFFVYDITGLDTPGGSDVSLWGKFIRPVNPDDPGVWGEYDPYGAIGKTMLFE